MYRNILSLTKIVRPDRVRAAGLLLIGCLLTGSIPAVAEEPITLDSLLGEMIDTARLGQYPDPAYETVQFSSYDRRSTVPEGPDWFANSDGFGNEPVPNFEAVLSEPIEESLGRYLICDVQGPGVIVRTWSAAIEGTIRVMLDDAEQPLYDGPASHFLQAGLQQLVEKAGLEPELYERTFRQRDACYFPIPFSQRCRIEWTGTHKKIHFYEVQVRKYAPSANIVGLNPAQVEQSASKIRRVAEVLGDPQGLWPNVSDQDPVKVEGAVAAGQSAELLKLDGPQAIECLTLAVAADDLDRALRQTILHINFDGHARDQVECPVGDFFGAGPGINPYNQVPFTVEPDGRMTCRFVMPFASSCTLKLVNRGEQSVHIAGQLRLMPWQWDDTRSMHFRARWRVDHDLVADSGNGAQDIPFLIARGQGVYVGTAIMLLNPNPIPTPYGNWWGEGDEKIFVDDDQRPSTFGTGSEDYFNYSWSSPDIFLFPYCGQPRNDGPANRGFVVNQRWHIMDALPFSERIAFYMELFSHERTPHFSYGRVSYHYGRPGLIDDSLALTSEDVRPLSYPPDWQPAARMGAGNSVFFQAEDVCANRDHTRQSQNDRWAGGRLLLWTPTDADSQLAFDIPVKEAGKYALHVTAATGEQSAAIVASLDGQPVRFGTETIDLKTAHRVLLRNFTSPTLELDAGTRRLVFRVAPDTQFTDQQPRIGIDFLWLQKR